MHVSIDNSEGTPAPRRPDVVEGRTSRAGLHRQVGFGNHHDVWLNDGNAGDRHAWSLSDMINFGMATFAKFIRTFETRLLRIEELNNGGLGANEIESGDGKEIQLMIKAARSIFADRVDENIDYALSALERSVARCQNYSQIYANMRAFDQAMSVFFQRKYFYQYPDDKMAIFRSWKADWTEVCDKFPSALLDIVEGVDCWALEHNAASVFHMMRVLEHGLSAMAQEVGTEFTTQSWHVVIENIESKIREQSKAKNSPEKIARLKFLSEAAKEFFYFKDGWRNYVSHNKGPYDEDQAKSLMLHVRAFMTILAKGLA